jgi:hypothetical protein
MLEVDEEGFYMRRSLPDGRIVSVMPLTFGRARIGIGDDNVFHDVW